MFPQNLKNIFWVIASHCICFYGFLSFRGLPPYLASSLAVIAVELVMSSSGGFCRNAEMCCGNSDFHAFINLKGLLKCFLPPGFPTLKLEERCYAAYMASLIIILTPVQDIQDIMLTPVWDYINLGYPHPGGEYQQEVERSAEGGPHLR